MAPPIDVVEFPGESFSRILNHIQHHLVLDQTCGVSLVPRVPDPKLTSDALSSLDDLQQQIDGCQRCALHAKRTQIVFGSGPSCADVMLVGEGPGKEEDVRGEPFVGPAGDLLTKILQAIQLTRDDVYMTDIVKCRPPEDRKPEAEEIATCAPFLQQQIACVKPKIICTLGLCAAQALLHSDAPLSELRGRFYDYGGIRVMPTYHPADLLQHSEYKRAVWQDMQQVQQAYKTL